MRILICDDEPSFAQSLQQCVRSFLQQLQWAVSVDCISDIHQMQSIDALQYDIAFLDIDMGSLNGIELARRMRKQRPDLILIFVTNYVQYSLEGYEVHAFRYLLKSQLETKLASCLSAAITAYQKDRNFIRFSCDGMETDLLPAHILFAETEGRRLRLHLKNEARESLTIHMTMGALTKLLQIRGFLRIHQSYLVNMAYIQQMKSTGVWLTNGSQLPISARNYQELKQEYLRWKGMKRWNM